MANLANAMCFLIGRTCIWKLINGNLGTEEGVFKVYRCRRCKGLKVKKR